jgi:hypothetical protein
MRFPRTTIRQLLLLVAALALVFGILAALQRRSVRFRRLASEYSSAKGAVYFNDMENGKDGQELTMEAVYYLSDLSDRYKAAADRPWLPLGADPPEPEGLRAFWKAHAAVKKSYPGLTLDDYTVFISVDDRETQPGQTVWKVRYNSRQDDPSGLNVFVDNSSEWVEMTLRGKGPPLARSDPK